MHAISSFGKERTIQKVEFKEILQQHEPVNLKKCSKKIYSI